MMFPEMFWSAEVKMLSPSATMLKPARSTDIWRSSSAQLRFARDEIIGETPMKSC